MAKKKKITSDDKKAVKLTVIFLFIFAFFAAMYLFFQNGNKGKDQQPDKPRLKQESKPKSQAVPAPSLAGKKKKAFDKDRMTSAKGVKIAFVLDDWGYSMNNCHYLKEIKQPLAIAVLPGIRHSDDIMKCASLYDKDIMLHLPLEPYHNPDPSPDYYMITGRMPLSKVDFLLEDTFKKMPMISGVNNHMGSKATEDAALMKFILKKLKKKGLFFIDSMTAPDHSVCGEIADSIKIPFGQRDVFLDNINTKEAIEKQFVELAQKAKHKGYAIAIGHDRRLTMQVIKDQIPILEKQGFVIVSVKDLLRNKSSQ